MEKTNATKTRKAKTALKMAENGNAPETTENEAPVVRLHPDHARYVRGLASTASGRDSYDIADEVANSLRTKTVDEVFEAVADQLTKLGEPATKASLAARWEGRNPGMQRMNAGNVLRGAIRRAQRKAAAQAATQEAQ
jgi:hypothetical protein